MGSGFLGVDRSLQGRQWRERLDDASAIHALAMGQIHGLPDVLARILAGRGQDAASCLRFLDPRLRDAMPRPDTLRDMEAAVARLAQAVQRRERVAVFGDYDVDGACSAALLAGFLRQAGADAVIHIPDRLTEGYGPNIPAIESLRREGASLLVTVDCGTTSMAPLARAAELGLDTVVIDHHQAEETLPAAVAVVNPNRQDDLSGLGHLCAAGVVFLVLVALRGALNAQGAWQGRPAPDLLACLDLVALATVADVVPLLGLNRAFVSQGLAVMRLRRRPGLAALCDVAGTNGPPTAFHLGFLLGPRINAGGRIGDAGLGARLLLSEDATDARSIAEQLDGLNRERRAIEKAAADEADTAIALAVGLAGQDPGAALVTSGDDWHPGIVGLVASRLRERYSRPSFAIAMRNGVGTGSGRSVPGVDLGRIVRAAVAAGLLVKGGGHAMAAGITMDAGCLDAFRAFLIERCAAEPGMRSPDDGFLVDAALTAGAADAAMVEALHRAAPFGTGNPEPVIAFARHRVANVATVGADHLRLSTVGPDGTRLDAVAFRVVGSAFGDALTNARGGVLHLAGALSVTRWGGVPRTELRLLDAAVPQDRADR